MQNSASLNLVLQKDGFRKKKKFRSFSISSIRNRGIRYIGSKARIAEEILIHIGSPETK